MIRRNIDLESQLIDDLLDLTRIARGKLQLQLEPLDAHKAIANVLEMCASELSEKRLQLSLELRAENLHDLDGKDAFLRKGQHERRGGEPRGPK